MIEQLAGATQGNKSRYEIGLNQICTTISEDILRDASPLWKQTRTVGEVMQLSVLTPEKPPIIDNPPVDAPIAEAAVFCTECGLQNPARSNFCFNCGTRLVKIH